MSTNRQAWADQAPEAAVTPPPPALDPETDTSEFCEGTVSEVMKRVDSDSALAQIAIQCEESKDNPRSTLLAQLNEIINPEDGA